MQSHITPASPFLDRIRAARATQEDLNAIVLSEAFTANGAIGRAAVVHTRVVLALRAGERR